MNKMKMSDEQIRGLIEKIVEEIEESTGYSLHRGEEKEED